MELLSAFGQYVAKLVVFAVVAVAGVFVGIAARKMKNKKNSTEE